MKKTKHPFQRTIWPIYMISRTRPNDRMRRSSTSRSVMRFILSIGIQRNPAFIAQFGPTAGRQDRWGGAAAGPARSSRRKSTLLAVPSLLDEKEFLQQMRAIQLDRRFPPLCGTPLDAFPHIGFSTEPESTRLCFLSVVFRTNLPMRPLRNGGITLIITLDVLCNVRIIVKLGRIERWDKIEPVVRGGDRHE